MYNRILTLQQSTYGPNDRRCFVTSEKIKTVQGKGVQYEGAIEELRKTFSVPTVSGLNASREGSIPPQSARKEKQPQSQQKKKKKKKVLKALASVMKLIP